MDAQIKEHLDAVYKEVETFLRFKPSCYIAGGSIASLVYGETPNDYDMWFEDPAEFKRVDVQLTHIVADHNDHVELNRTKYATTLILPSGKKVQFVQNRMGSPSVLVPQFDFRHTQSYYLQDGTLSYDKDFIQRRCLEFKGNLDHPINTMERVLKFSKRGFFVPFETLQALMIEINKLNIETIKSMEKHGGSL